MEKSMSNKSIDGNDNISKDSGKSNVADTKKTSTPMIETKVVKNKTPVKKKAKNHQSAVSVIAMTIGLLAVCFAVYNFWVLQDQTRSTIEITKTQQNLESRIDQLGQSLQIAKNDIEKEIHARESAQAEHHGLNTAMQNGAAKLDRSTEAWKMAEVENLLTVANHRLTVAQDRATAIAIFETADERIKAIGDSSLIKVRKVIADELLALRAMPKVDISGLAIRVGSMVKSVDQLQLLDKKRIAVETNDKSENAQQLIGNN